MKIPIQVKIENEQGQPIIEDIAQLVKGVTEEYLIGLSLSESKVVLKKLQTIIVAKQTQQYAEANRCCTHCQQRRRIKVSTRIQCKTLFGIASLPNQRLYHCTCHSEKEKTLSLLSEWLPEYISPELQYIETQRASLMSYGLSADLLKDVLPIHATLNVETIRRHLHKTANHQDEALDETPEFVSGCAYEWGQLPKPDKPLTVGIDGGYVKNCCDKKSHFQVIVGKFFSKARTGKRFGFVQTLEENSKKRLMSVLENQGMQANQQITFSSDGGDAVRELQYIMHPEVEHILGWFHVPMRLTVLGQFAKGLVLSDPEEGARVTKDLDSAKWYLWNGNVKKATGKLDYCYCILDDEGLYYSTQLKFQKMVVEMLTYI
ncbi:MAG: hypothetical protein ACI9Y1_000751, partial [Lentisphaeria bacterium]